MPASGCPYMARYEHCMCLCSVLESLDCSPHTGDAMNEKFPCSISECTGQLVMVGYFYLGLTFIHVGQHESKSIIMLLHSCWSCKNSAVCSQVWQLNHIPVQPRSDHPNIKFSSSQPKVCGSFFSCKTFLDLHHRTAL